MKYLYIIIVMFMFGCTGSPIETFTYTVKNNSGVSIKVIGHYFYTDKEEKVTFLKNEEELTEVFKSDRNNFNLGYFFTSTVRDEEVRTRIFTDSITVIYNNEKYKVFTSFVESNEDIRNPLNPYTDSKFFTFTEEDYNNAIDCDGNCD